MMNFDRNILLVSSTMLSDIFKSDHWNFTYNSNEQNIYSFIYLVINLNYTSEEKKYRK